MDPNYDAVEWFCDAVGAFHGVLVSSLETLQQRLCTAEFLLGIARSFGKLGRPASALHFGTPSPNELKFATTFASVLRGERP